MSCLVFVRLSHIDQHVGGADGFVCLVQWDLLHQGLGGGDEIVGCFHVGVPAVGRVVRMRQRVTAR